MSSKNLIIVESPGKCKKIELLTGFKCMASYGHIMDIPHNLKWFDHTNIDPQYEVTSDKKKVVSDLKKTIGPKKDKCRVLIAADMDREGEAIAENLMRALKLDIDKTERIRFNQITKNALSEAIDNPGKLDVNLFHAQQARRILDMLYGFTVSPYLWSHIQRGLSAGRCQSPAVRLCLERQREQKLGKKYYKAAGILNHQQCKIEIIRKTKLEESLDIEKWIDTVKSYKFMYVNKIKESVKKTNPPPPCITSTLQQEVYKRYGINPENCMKSAQRLYEQGYITYMRTDSTDLSNDFRNDAKNYIHTTYGEKFHKWNVFGKKKNTEVKAQEAHEAIRPIKVDKIPSNNDISDLKVFTVIWMRAVGSQMSAAEYDEFHITFTQKKELSRKDEIWESVTKNLKFKGYLILKSPFYESSSNDESLEEQNKSIKREFPKVKENDELEIYNLNVKECYETPPPPFSQADLIKTLEKTGIGRPSTFSSIVNKIQHRGYVILGQNEILDQKLKNYAWNFNKELKITEYTQKIGGQKNVFVVTPLGTNVTEFLENKCNTIIQADFTSKLEETLDLIAKGQTEWKSFISKFYVDLKSILSSIEPPENIGERSINWLKTFSESENNKLIGFVQTRNGTALAESENNKIIKYAALPPKTSKIDTIDFDEAMFILSLPIKIGEYEGKDVLLNLGRYGWYVVIDSKNISIHNNRKVPEWEDIEKIIKSPNTKNTKLKEISNVWSIWYNPSKQSHFLMKKIKSKVNFYSLPNYNSDKEYTEQMCEEISNSTKKSFSKKK